MTTYIGERIGSRVLVRVDDEPLCLRLDLFPYSPNGFGWGDPGSGPAQLALAILADHLPSDENRALAQHQRFKERVIGRLAPDRSEVVDHKQHEILRTTKSTKISAVRLSTRQAPTPDRPSRPA